jgi:hypothetical protein
MADAVVDDFDRCALDAEHLAHERSETGYRSSELAAEDGGEFSACSSVAFSSTNMPSFQLPSVMTFGDYKDRRDDRRDQVIHERVDQRAEGDADHDPDGEVDRVPAQQERAELRHTVAHPRLLSSGCRSSGGRDRPAVGSECGVGDLGLPHGSERSAGRQEGVSPPGSPVYATQRACLSLSGSPRNEDQH